VLVGRSAFIGNKIRDSAERDRELMQFKLQLLRQVLEKKMDRKKIRALMNFLKYYVHFDNQYNNVIFDKQIQTVTGRGETMGIEELMLDRATKQGEEKKSYEFVSNLILQTDFDDKKISNLAEVSIEFVQKIRSQLNKKNKAD